MQTQEIAKQIFSQEDYDFFRATRNKLVRDWNYKLQEADKQRYLDLQERLDQAMDGMEGE